MFNKIFIAESPRLLLLYWKHHAASVHSLQWEIHHTNVVQQQLDAVIPCRCHSTPRVTTRLSLRLPSLKDSIRQLLCANSKHPSSYGWKNLFPKILRTNRARESNHESSQSGMDAGMDAGGIFG